MSYFTGKGYGVSSDVDVNGTPLLSYTFTDTGKTITLWDRVAVQVDPFDKSPKTLDQIYNSRIDLGTSAAIKKAIGGTSAQELDHKISLELGGSNQLANLGLDQNTPGTANNPTDTFENELAAAVQAGVYSLSEAWDKIAQAKGFSLAENMVLAPSDAWASAASVVAAIISGNAKATQSADEVKNLNAMIQQDHLTLLNNPFDLPTRTKIFTEQINMTAEQLNLSKSDAAAYMSVYTAKYAQAKGQDPRNIMGALNKEAQQLIGISYSQPNLLNVPITTWTQVAAAIAAFSGPVALVVGLVVALIGFFFAPEEAGTVAAGGFLATIAGWIGLPGYAIAGAAAATATFAVLNELAIAIPMITKQMLDSSTIVPNMTASTLVNLQKLGVTGQTGGTTSSGTSGTQPVPGGGAYTPVGSQTPSGAATGGQTPSGAATGGQTPSGAATGGQTPSGAAQPQQSGTFIPQPASLIQSADDLKGTAIFNITDYLAAISSEISYEIKLITKVIGPDGFQQSGSVQTITTGYTTKGTPKKKTTVNKFAEAVVYLNDYSGKRTKISTIPLGPVDSSAYKPAKGELDQMAEDVHAAIEGEAAAAAQAPSPAQPGSQSVSGSSQPVLTPQSASPTVPATPTAPLPQTYGRDALGVVELPGPNPALGGSANVRRNSDGIVGWIEPGTTIPAGWDTYPTSGGKIVSGGTPPPGYSNPSSGTAATSTGAPSGASSTASDLSAYYSSQGQNLPPLAQRAQTWESLNLGPAAYYVGSAVQNAQLLSALQNKQSAPQAKPAAALNAQDLAAYYTAIGQTLPTLSARAQLYQNAGLGSAASYVGSAVQNSALLNYLKTH